MEKIFSQSDLEQIKSHGLTVEGIARQIQYFRDGFDYLPVKKAAVVGDGIMLVEEGKAGDYAMLYENRVKQLKVVKFVPASGAATRMFKSLFEFVGSGKKDLAVDKVLENVKNFAFYDVIKGKISGQTPEAMAKAILDYGAELPKALILFHNYPDNPRTALEEHLVEGAMYAASGDTVNIHLTISPEHEKGFEKLLADVKSFYEKKFGVTYNIAMSQQRSDTDTIAVTPDNEPFREADGSLLFRPAGHGALIENLNDVDADIVFIKTIDNVTPDELKADTVLYKKVIAGILLEKQAKIFEYIEKLDRSVEKSMLLEVKQFVESELEYKLPKEFDELTTEDKIKFLKQILDRPIRVCGMVRNEGEPGGGPFWVSNSDGSLSLQIGESAQIDPLLMDMMRNGTHFNPVDIVCGVKDYQGNKFDLRKYVDPSTGFISEKSKDGRPLKAQERPGLWNGAMANWNTIFVDVPISTFTPVKEVADLLRPTHIG